MSITLPNRLGTFFNATAALFGRPRGGRMGRKFFDHLGVAKPGLVAKWGGLTTLCDGTTMREVVGYKLDSGGEVAD